MTALLTDNLPLLAGAPNGIKKLRELILELAVRGKLVPQDPNDEPASELLKRITEEKARLVAEGKIKKAKPTNADLTEISYEIPSTWAVASLGQVVEIVRGITFPASEKSKEPEPGRVACLRTANVQDEIEWDDLLYIRESFVSRHDQYVEAHDIVMSMANSRELVGKVALIGAELKQKTTFGGFLGVLRPVLIEPRFVMALLRTPHARNALIDSASQTTNIANVSLGKLRPLPFAIPPLAEQHRIVAKVDELMALCERLEAQQADADSAHAELVQALLNSLTQASDADDLAQSWQRLAEHFHTLFTTESSIDALKQTLLQLAVMGKLVPQDPNDEPASELLKRITEEKAQLVAGGRIKKQKTLPEIADEEMSFQLPVGWEWVRLNSLLKKIGAGSTPLGGKQGYVSEGIKFLRSQNVWNEGLRLDDVALIPEATHQKMAGTHVEAGDLLFNITGASIGRCAIVPDDFDTGNVSQHVTIIRPVAGELRHFLHVILTSQLVQQTVMDVQVGVSREGLSIGKLSVFVIPCPPEAEQHRIVAKVDQLMTLCDQLKTRLSETRQLHEQLASTLVEQALA
jgi:type I restriction enzyme S subunit